jgi:hypothetical protein
MTFCTWRVSTGISNLTSLAATVRPLRTGLLNTSPVSWWTVGPSKIP